MKYVYAALLLHSSAQPVTEENVKKVVTAAGSQVEEAQVKALVAALSEINIDEALKSASVMAAPAAAPAAPAEAKKEDKGGSRYSSAQSSPRIDNPLERQFHPSFYISQVIVKGHDRCQRLIRKNLPSRTSEKSASFEENVHPAKVTTGRLPIRLLAVKSRAHRILSSETPPQNRATAWQRCAFNSWTISPNEGIPESNHIRSWPAGVTMYTSSARQSTTSNHT